MNCFRETRGDQGNPGTDGKDGNFVWLSMAPIEKNDIGHFPNIYEHCLEEGYDVTKSAFGRSGAALAWAVSG